MKMTARKMPLTAVLILTAGLVWLPGCQSVNTVERAAPEGRRQMVDDKRVSTDYTLSRSLQVTAVNETTVSGDMLKIQVEVRNTSSRPKNFNYKFEWFDMDGMAVDSPLSAWKPARLKGKETMMLTAAAPNPRAKDFKLKLQEP